MRHPPDDDADKQDKLRIKEELEKILKCREVMYEGGIHKHFTWTRQAQREIEVHNELLDNTKKMFEQLLKASEGKQDNEQHIVQKLEEILSISRAQTQQHCARKTFSFFFGTVIVLLCFFTSFVCSILGVISVLIIFYFSYSYLPTIHKEVKGVRHQQQELHRLIVEQFNKQQDAISRQLQTVANTATQTSASIDTLESALRDSAQQLTEENHGLKQFIDTKVSTILDTYNKQQDAISRQLQTVANTATQTSASIGTLESALRDSAQQLAKDNHGLKQFIDAKVSAILDICKRMENINGDNYEAYQRTLENTKVELLAKHKDMRRLIEQRFDISMRTTKEEIESLKRYAKFYCIASGSIGFGVSTVMSVAAGTVFAGPAIIGIGTIIAIRAVPPP